MLVCRKCQTQHEDGTRTCTCGADLRRDGIPVARRTPVGGSSRLPAVDLSVGEPIAPLPTIDRQVAPPAGEPGTPLPPLGGPDAPAPDERASRPAPRAPRSRPPAREVRRDGPPAPQDRGRRGVEPGELARMLRAPGSPPASAGPSPGPVVHADTPRPAAADPGAEARGRGVAPEDVRRAQDPDRPNVHGDAATPASPVEGGEAPPRPPKAGEAACARCSEPNPDTRRFCQSCGEKLPAFHNRLAGVDLDDDEPPPPRNTLWRRLTGTTVTEERDNRTWRQRARDAGHGRIRYETGLSPKARLAMVAGGIGAAAAAALALGPLRPQLTELFDTDPAGTSPASAALVRPADGAEPVPADDAAVPGFGPRGAIDGEDGTGVAFVLDDAGNPATDVRLALALAEPAAVDELVLLTGLSPDHEEVRLVPRPSVVEVCPDDGPCLPVPLQDTSEPQRVRVGLPITRGLTVRVPAIHPTVGQFIPLTVIREVRVIN